MAADPAGQRFDLIIVDVFSGDVAPRHISTAEFFAMLGKLLRPDGIIIVNTLATRGLGFTREALATMSSVFPEVLAVGAPSVTEGKAIGNIALVASRHDLDGAAIAEALVTQPRTIGVTEGDAIVELVAGAAVRRD